MKLRILLSVLLAASTMFAQRPFGIATVAGTPYDPSGDGGPAKLASIGLAGVAFRDGNLYLTDGSRVRKVAPSGIITTVVGLLDPVVHQPIAGFSGDGGPALGAQVRGVGALEFDNAGNLYLTDGGNSCIRKVTARVVGGVAQPLDGSEIITTVAGTPMVVGNSGDGGPATAAKLNSPNGLAFDPGTGTLYINDQNNDNIRKVSPAGTITTLAGTGTAGNSGDNGPAVNAQFNLNTGITVDPGTGDVYVADVLNSRIRKITASTGIITTFAGTGTSSSVGSNLNEGGAALAANVHAVKLKFLGGALYFLDSGVGMLRQISGGVITTIAGIGLPSYSGAFPPVGDGGPALSAKLGSGVSGVVDMALDRFGGFFVADASSRRVRFVAGPAATVFGQTVAAGNIGTVAGPPGIVTFGGDGGPASLSRFFGLGSLAFDPAGNLYLNDSGNVRVRMINAPVTSGTIATVAGNGVAGFAGVPGPATAANIQPGGLAYNSGSLYLTNNSSRVLKDSAANLTISVNNSGVTTSMPPTPDGTPAINANLSPTNIAFDTAGNYYLGDAFNFRVWKVDTSGFVSTVVGGGSVILSGAMSTTGKLARIFGAGGLAFDPTGNLYLTDGSKDRILKVTAHSVNQPLDGMETVTIFAGTGMVGYSGDGGPAAAANLNGPGTQVFDAAGNLYFGDGGNVRVRKIDTNGVISTIAGHGVAGFEGDGGLATAAEIRGGSLAIDSFGNIFMSDGANQVIRVLDNIPPALNPVISPNPVAVNGAATVTAGTSDTGAGVASQSCGALVTNSVGTKSVTCTATDRAGNTASVTANYLVGSGNVTVQSGQTFNFVNGTITGNLTNNGGTVVLNNSTVTGNLMMNGGSLVLTGGSTVKGNLQITGGTFSVGPGASISGNLQVQNLPAGGAPDKICGASVHGNLMYQNSGAAIVIGSTSCLGNTVNGNLQIQNDTSAITANNNQVGGNLQVQNNTASVAVFDNAVTSNLQCEGNNAASISGGGNTARSKQGQCAAF